MSQLNKNFAAYLQQNYKDTIEEAIRSYIVDEELMGCFDVEHLRTLDYLNIDFDLIDIFFEDTNNASLCFPAVAHCYYSFHIYSHNECIHFQDDNVERWLKIFLTSSIGVRLYDLNAYCVEIYSKETYILEQNTGELIPYIFEEDLERIAESFLIKYCPMALTEPMALPIEDIAENMGLEIFCLDMSGDIFGELFFENIGYDSCIGEDISRGTLLLNQRYVRERSDGAKNFTIAHECVHWARHRKYMDLNRILHQDVSSSIECPTSSKGWHQLQKTFRDMEWQANNLAARILMPEKMTRQKLNELIRDLKKRVPNTRNGLIMANAIRKLAEFYQVSIATAKYRAIQLGFEQAAGCFNYVDDHIIEPIWFKDGALSKYQTFVIDRPIAEKEIAEKEELNFLVQNRRVVYLNGMFICNHPRYIEVDAQGDLKPTKYALEHADECCLVLTVQQTWNQEDCEDLYASYFLSRPANPAKNSKGSILLDDPRNRYLVQKIREPEKIRQEIDGMIELLEQGLSGVFPDKAEDRKFWMIEGFLPTTLHQKLQ